MPEPTTAQLQHQLALSRQENAVLAAELQGLRQTAGYLTKLLSIQEELYNLKDTDGKLLATVRNFYKTLDERMLKMAATITDLQNNLATLKTKLDAQIAKGNGAATADQVDAANTAVVGMIQEIDAANAPPADTTGGATQPNPPVTQ